MAPTGAEWSHNGATMEPQWSHNAYTFTHTDTHTQTHTHTQTDRRTHTDTQTHRQRHIIKNKENGPNAHQPPFFPFLPPPFLPHPPPERYMTWDKTKFPDPASMQRALNTKQRKMVNIVDPHIKRAR